MNIGEVAWNVLQLGFDDREMSSGDSIAKTDTLSVTQNVVDML